MDIKVPNQTPSGGPPTAAAGDMLQRLQVAGSIEAEVVRVLADRLLLRTDLGEILTRNTLRYQEGDRVKLRLDDTAATPVLKVSAVNPRPISLESSRYPELARLLPANRPVLAAVLKILAQATLLRISGQELILPRRIDTTPGQLLSLVRRPQLRAIEVDSVSLKSVFRTLLRQLMPQIAGRRDAALVKLFELVSEATGKAPKATSPVAPGATATAREVKSRAAPPTPSSALPPRPAPVTLTPQLRLAPAAASPGYTALLGLNPRTEFPGGSAVAAPRPAHPATTRQLPSPGQHPAPAKATGDSSTIGRQRTSAGLLLQGRWFGSATDVPGQPLPRPATSGLQVSGSTTGGSPRAIVATAADQVATAIAQIRTRARPESSRAAAKPDLTEAAVPRGGRFAQPETQLVQRSFAIGPATTSPGATASAGSATAAAPAPGSALLAQLQALPGMEKIDAPELRRWFQLLGFVRPATGGKTTPQAGEILRLLQPLTTTNNLARELLGAMQSGVKTSTDSETAAARAPTQEALLPLLRDGIRLLEQALAQNLLQRATLGMQQESQQPMTLAFALPYLEAEQVRPLQIELEQRNQASDAASRSWEIRLSFELADQGPVTCHIVLEGHTVAASFYCALAQTRERFEQALPELQRQLFDVGLVAGEMHSFLGIPPTPEPAAAFVPGDSLIDIEV